MSKFIPNSFQVPNAVIDELMSVLSGADFKCYMLVVRQTTGWNKQKDAVSISQMMEKCSLSNRGVIDACEKLVELGLLTKSKGFRGMNVFSVNFDKVATCELSSHVNSAHSTCELTSQVPMNSAHTQNTTKQNTNTKNTNLTVSNARTKKTSEFDLLEQFGIEGDLASDFIKHRKAIKKPITDRVMKMLKTQADIAGIPIQLAVEIVLAATWQSFQADFTWRPIAAALGWRQFGNTTQQQQTNRAGEIQDTTGFAKGMTIEDGNGGTFKC